MRDSPEELRAHEELLAEVSHEFSAGLPGRLETLRAALDELARGFEREVAEVFYRSAHSLKGTALSFGGREMADHAAALADTGHRWLKQAGVAPDELTTAMEEIERLGSAVARYRARIEGRGA